MTAAAAKDRAYVGHYGCAGRLVKVRQRRFRADPHESEIYHRGKPPQSKRVDCPACGFTHPVAIAWREARDGELELAELTID